MRGTLPLYDHHINSIIDARIRLLKPGGVLIPQKDVLYAAVVSSPKLYNHYVQAWDEFNYGLNMEAARQLTVNGWGSGRPEPEQLLSASKVVVELDYHIIEEVNLSSTVTWEVDKAGVANGICVWFDMTMAYGLGIL